jgi:phosphoribosyl 1,2-cyclic phosphate phosphodiesterase
MEGRLTFMGTGTSMGVPTLGCDCPVCNSSDPRDRRLRPSVLLRWEDGDVERNVVIDTGPDFREQALRAGLKHVDAVFYTHSHADHIFGMDDLRPLSFLSYRASGNLIPLYATADTAGVLERIYDYTFSPNSTYPNRARVRLEPIGDCATVHGVEFVRVPLLHGRMKISGYRFGNTAYLTDVSDIPEASFALLEGVENLVLSGGLARGGRGLRTSRTTWATKRRTAGYPRIFNWPTTGRRFPSISGRILDRIPDQILDRGICDAEGKYSLHCGLPLAG